jgi:menaquinol-cytochrome c reductase iron-sulfur subunit
MENQTRRTFYTGLLSAVGAVIGLGMALPAAAYLLAAGKSKKKGNFVEAAKLTQLQIGKPQEVTFERTRVDGWRTFKEKGIAWVVRTGDNNVVAYSPQCTHLGCAYHWEGRRNEFVCPCHESRFSVDGKVMGGPAARPLDQYVTRVENESLLIGTEIRKA